MDTIRSTQARDWRERRCVRAWELHQQGWPQCRIADTLGVRGVVKKAEKQ